MAQEDYATLSWGQHEALQGGGGVIVDLYVQNVIMKLISQA
jgi:hypothetical protein